LLAGKDQSDSAKECDKMNNRGELCVLSCTSGTPFAKKIMFHLNEIYVKENEKDSPRFIELNEIHFANSEIKTEITQSIRGSDVYIIQDVVNSITGYSVDENLRALKTTMDAAYRSGANRICIVVPTFPYARQDKSNSREGITAAKIAEEIELCKANQILTLDIHNTAIGGFFRNALLEDLHASRNILTYVKDNIDTKNLIVLAPDTGGAKRAEYYASKLQTELGFIYKSRDYSKPNSVKSSVVLGDVKDKTVLLVDDLIDTAGTVVSAVTMIKKEGAKDVYFSCSLPLLNGPAIDRLDALYKQGHLKGLIGTDAVYHGDDFSKKYPWFIEVSVARYFARVIFNINHNRSISELLK
jgi:ribose-phosphate pyrophosphokinase